MEGSRGTDGVIKEGGNEEGVGSGEREMDR